MLTVLGKVVNLSWSTGHRAQQLHNKNCEIIVKYKNDYSAHSGRI